VAYVKRLYVVALEGPTSHQTRKTPQRSKGAYHSWQEQGQRTSQYQGERRRLGNGRAFVQTLESRISGFNIERAGAG